MSAGRNIMRERASRSLLVIITKPKELKTRGHNKQWAKEQQLPKNQYRKKVNFVHVTNVAKIKQKYETNGQIRAIAFQKQ